MKFGNVAANAEINVSSQQIAVTPSATITLDITTGSIAAWTAGENETVNASGTQVIGQRLTCIIRNDSVLPRTITFGTGFIAAATAVGTTNTTTAIEFVSNGTSFFELARTPALA